MKGPSLQRQYNKFVSEDARHRADFDVVQQISETYDYPGCGCERVEIHTTSVSCGYEWKLIINNPEKFKECCKKPNKELKCKDCNECGLEHEKFRTFIPCCDIQRLEWG